MDKITKINKTKIIILISFLISFIIFISVLTEAVNEPYKPYLHNPVVPEHKKIDLAGTFNVDLFSGQATYNYLIKTPKGTNNLKPELMLLYKSHSTYEKPTILGTGWNINYNYIQRDTNYTFSDINDDEYVLYLNNNKYELLYNSSNNKFHTKIESYMHITNMSGGENQKNTYWIIKFKNGDTYRFGYNNNSEMVSNQYDYVWRWNLDLIYDTHNNSVFYTYEENPNTNDIGVAYIKEIEYNNDKKRSIGFNYETSQREDLWILYDDGNKVSETRRLKEIIVKADNNLVNKYLINYSSFDDKTRSSISEIKIYGTDNNSCLPSNRFEYYPVNEGWITNLSWEIPSGAVFIDDTDKEDLGVRIADINGDGLPDLVKRDDNSHKGIWLNTGSGWSGQPLDSPWQIPSDAAFVDDNGGTDEGVRIADINGDGLPDLVKRDDNSHKGIWLNTGSGWSGQPLDSPWQIPTGAAFIHYSDKRDLGIRIVDINNDQLPDLIRRTDDNNHKDIWLNTGSSWSWQPLDSPWQIPSDAAFVDDNGGTDKGVRIVDINGDGLPDLVKRDDNSHKGIWLNTGSGWSGQPLDSPWQIPSDAAFVDDNGGTDEGVRIVDINGDGLPDLVKRDDSSNSYGVWINTGNGWSEEHYDSSWQIPSDVAFVDDNGENEGVRIADINGDGLADLIKRQDCTASICKNVWLNKASKSYLLKKVTNEMGGTIEISYEKSTSKDNTGDDSLNDINFNVWLVSSVTKNNGMNNDKSVVSIDNYDYQAGDFDHEDKEFRGFGYVEENKSNNVIIKHKFHQDDSKKSLEYETEILDSGSNPFKKEVLTWENMSFGNYHITNLISKSTYVYDGTYSNPKITNMSHEYDQYGNINKTSFFGDVNVSNDEYFQYVDYSYNENKWIINKPKIIQTFSFDETTKLRETKFYYDDLNYGNAPSKGDLTKKEDWSENGNNLITTYDHDSYGNEISETNPMNHTTHILYGIKDTTYTFPEKIINPKGHAILNRYDLGNSNILYGLDSNGKIINYTYDVYGRILKEILPYDSLSFPTIEYEYGFDGRTPSNISLTFREQTLTNNFTKEVYYYDGFGNLIQIKKESENGLNIFLDFYYDELWRLYKASYPYFSGENPYNLSYVYDPINRIIVILNPDNSNKTVIFDHWKISTFDEKGHKLDYFEDAYGNIIKIIESDDENNYITQYNYNPIGDLINITDDLGNIFTYDFDSLGRKISLSEPDIGHWNFYYDNNGNIINRTGENRNLIKGDGFYREYDELGQLIRIRKGYNSTYPLIEEYTYDPNGERIKIKRFDSANTTIYTPFKEFMMIQNSSGTYNYTYIYQENKLVARINPDGSKWYYHLDSLDSVNIITDGNGDVIENSSYYPYGAIFEGGNFESKSYTGQFNDKLTKQYYYGARYYVPEYGFFVQPDPIISNYYNPQNLNRYAYALNNPYKYNDPDGRSPTLVTGAIGAGVGGLIGGGWSIGSQLYNAGEVNWGDVGKSAGIGAVSGGVAGLTLGLGSVAIGAYGLTGGSALMVESTATVTSSLLAGQTSRAGMNLINGNSLAKGLGNPKDMVLDGSIGLVTFGLGKGYQHIYQSNKFSIIYPNKNNELHKSIYKPNAGKLNEGYIMDMYNKGEITVHRYGAHSGNPNHRSNIHIDIGNDHSKKLGVEKIGGDNKNLKDLYPLFLP